MKQLTVAKALRSGAAALLKLGPSAWREAEDLLAFVLKRSREHLEAYPKQSLSRLQELRYGRLIARRKRGAPLAYLLGEQPFCGLTFAIRRGVLIPRPETEQLVELALAASSKNRPSRIADIGTGSGCIAVAIAKNRHLCRLIAVDRSPTALTIARQNANRHGVTKRCRFVLGDLLAPLKNTRLDLIVANLPYLTPSEINAEPTIRFEPRLALNGGRDGLVVFRRFFRQLKQRRDRTVVLLETDPRRKRTLEQLAERMLPGTKRSWYRDLGGRWRILSLNRGPIAR